MFNLSLKERSKKKCLTKATLLLLYSKLNKNKYIFDKKKNILK